jgi:hypothetical protein
MQNTKLKRQSVTVCVDVGIYAACIVTELLAVVWREYRNSFFGESA